MTREDVVRAIQREKGAGTMTGLAERWQMSAQYLSDVVRGRVEPGPLVLDALGLERVVTYRKRKVSGE